MKLSENAHAWCAVLSFSAFVVGYVIGYTMGGRPKSRSEMSDYEKAILDDPYRTPKDSSGGPWE